MRIEKAPDIKEKFFNDIRANWRNRVKEKIHLSDCLAPRKAYFERMVPKDPTAKEIMYWLTGQGHEAALLRASGYKHGDVSQWNGLYYTPDIFEDDLIEAKTRRRNLAEEGKEAEVYESYIKQLKGYCAVNNLPQGQLWVWCLLHKEKGEEATSPEFEPYMVYFEPEELEAERQRLLKTKKLIEDAFANQDHRELPMCPEWMCAKTKRTIKVYPKCLTCDREFKTAWGIQKHLSVPKNSEHEIQKTQYEYIVYEKCKWHEECRGTV